MCGSGGRDGEESKDSRDGERRVKKGGEGAWSGHWAGRATTVTVADCLSHCRRRR